MILGGICYFIVAPSAKARRVSDSDNITMIKNSLKVFEEVNSSGPNRMDATGVTTTRSSIESPNANGSTPSFGSSIKICVGNAYDYDKGSIKDILFDLETTSQPNLSCSPISASLGKWYNRIDMLFKFRSMVKYWNIASTFTT